MFWSIISQLANLDNVLSFIERPTIPNLLDRLAYQTDAQILQFEQILASDETILLLLGLSTAHQPARNGFSLVLEALEQCRYVRDQIDRAEKSSIIISGNMRIKETHLFGLVRKLGLLVDVVRRFQELESDPSDI